MRSINAEAVQPAADRRTVPTVAAAGRPDRRVLWFRLLLLAGLIGSWEAAVRLRWMKPLFTSQPSAFLPALWAHLLEGSLLKRDLPQTLYETFAGFAVASVLGIGLALLLHEFPLLDAVIQPFLTAFNSMPRVALAPLFVLWFGLGPESKVVLVISLVFFIVIINTLAGLKASDRDHLLLARTLGVGRWQRFWKFVFPAATPAIFAGLQLGLVYALLGAITGEILGGHGGVGARMAVAINTFSTDDFFADLLFLVLFSTALALLVQRLERWLLHWRYIEMRGIEHG
jgi:NitT/TauT family transport system permease protein